MYYHYFSNFGRPPILDNLSKDSATRHPRFWKRIFFKGFYHIWTYMDMAAILVNGTATILAIFHFPAPGRLQMKFEQHWHRGSRGEDV